MNVTPITRPLPGEHLAATWPTMRPELDDPRPRTDPRWRERLRFWSGRSLTADGLERDQENRAARLTWFGRATSAGIVTGLELALEPPAEPADPLASAGHFIHVLPGYGITALGDDVTVPRPLRLPLEQIPMRGLAAGTVPWAAVLVVRPAEFGRFDNVDPTDPCELDPSADAFADERRQDAVVFELLPLPAEWQALPELGNVDDLRWRNRLAYLLFADQAARSARQQLRFRDALPSGQRWDTVQPDSALHPWELEGVALALLSTELIPGTVRRRFFLDRASVARVGGRARSRTRPTVRLATAASEAALHPPGAGDAALWRARVDQFAEHFSALDPDAAIATQTQFFQFLPPAGLLPKGALDIVTTADAVALNATDRAAVSRFLPATMSVEAVPVPIEDLDAALATSAPLAPFDLATNAPDLARILVPVPQRVFDPNLLVIEQEDPFFAAELARLIGERQGWRQARDVQRVWRDTLLLTAGGPSAVRPAPAFDPGQLEPEPIEISAPLNLLTAFRSPAESSGPWELSAEFTRASVTPLTATSLLYIRLRADNELPPPRIIARWRAGNAEFAFDWTAPSDSPREIAQADGSPLPLSLWRLYTATAAQLGLTAGTLSGFTLHIDSGRVALLDAGVVGIDPATGLDGPQPWWRADAQQAPVFSGGDWIALQGATQMTAPFETLNQPLLDDDRPLAERVKEIDLALNPEAATSRAKPVSTAVDGLDKVLAELEGEANEADDFVDANFIRAQTNLYRVRKLILGQSAAQKLLINPAIATIADQETATATAEQLGAYITAARTKVVSAADVRRAVSAEPASRVEAGTAAPFFASRATFLANPLVGASVEKIQVSDTLQFSTNTNVKAAALADGLKARKDIFGQLPEAGPTLPPRGLSIGQRFPEPKATENLSFARAALNQLLAALPRIRLPMVNETIRSMNSGVLEDIKLLDLQGRSKPPVNSAETPATLRTAAVTKLLAPPTITNDTDEAEVTLAALDLTETKSSILRTIERVIQQRRELIARGRQMLTAIRTSAIATDNRLGAMEPRLAEARHDVSVARALRAEEQARIAAINERRDTILRDDVRFLAFVRPRAFDPVRRVSTAWRLEQSEALGDVPACLAQHDEPPDELRAYVQLFRHAPARWFTSLAPRLKQLNTRPKLVELLAVARQSAIQFTSAKQLAFVRQDGPAGPRATIQSAFSIVESFRRETARILVAPAASVTWAEQQRAAEQSASIGDLIDGRHGESSVSRAASEQIEQIEDVATCLHAEFAAVSPAIRLAWVERYSQFDRPSPLNDLTVLPRYVSLSRTARRRFQALVDWLFGQVDRGQRDAVSLINDLVRLCLLLASHAPVKQLIAGHVPRPVAVRPGVRIPLRPLDPALVRVGMEFHVWQASKLVARGRVDDLQDGEVSAVVDHVATTTSMTTLDQTMRVQFVPAAFGFAKAAAAR